MGKHITFFVGLLVPVFVMVSLVRIVVEDMAVWKGIWSIWTLVFTLAVAAAGTILEVTMKTKPKKKVGQK